MCFYEHLWIFQHRQLYINCTFVLKNVMAENEFQIGDVVCLKSGGMHMTIQRFYNDEKECICSWLDKNGRPHEKTFTKESLTFPSWTLSV